ncbi:maltodextrin glucosidase [Escherichia coli]|nr:maltodextrin glucosidase [Escherichia coli]HAW4062580.1 maltodextrin glucosidase [Escherichia coli]HCN9843208.1 maltodextrin glucosidase [Escherichia coli]HCO2143524.1 maltodextrin glucosidase [Escherichia coli]HDV4908741.1 maltodextrin glucosidase [Escherichia coli]
MMLNAWHLPVPPFVKQSKDQLLITLWLTGEDPPQRIMLRTEHDNEEMSVPMHKQRSQPQPGVTAWRAAIDLSSGQPRRRYSFKLLWHDRQRWFTPQGFSRMPPARLEQFAVDVPDIGPQWAADQIFYQIFPDRFARSLPREAEQDHVYYHHAAGQEIILRDWDEPVTALDWLGYASLPKLDYQSESLVNEIYRGEDSIVRHWLKAPWNMDGWRLDVVHMLGEAGGARNNMQHVAGITEAAKETQPEAYIVGEHFGDARQWLQADVEDAAMNYRGFTFPLWGFLANTDISYDPQQIDAQTCMAWMDNYRAGLSHQQQLRMFNQLDSHDTARFKTLLGRDIARLPLAVVWLFTWPGVPCIYYGDEVGLDGKNDPFCRKPFPWQVEKQDTALFALYQRMIALRKKSQALRHGGCQVLYAEDNVVVFVRVLNQQRVLVAINRGEACEVVLPASPFLNAVQWQCKEGHGQLTDGILALPAISATVWMN